MNQRQIDENDEIDAGRMFLSCGCPECDNGVQPGHFACEASPPEMLQMERDGVVARAYDNGSWQWFVRTLA